MYKPERLYKELFSQHKGSRDLTNRPMCSVSQGTLIFFLELGCRPRSAREARSHRWCSSPFPEQHATPLHHFRWVGWCWIDCSVRVAHSLKLKLVNTGGSFGKLCIIPLVFLLSPDKPVTTLHGSDCKFALSPITWWPLRTWELCCSPLW